MKRLLTVTASLAVLVGAGASGAFAGEVKGPPGDPNDPNQPHLTDQTGAVAHANSECAFSGLNDFDPEEGQNVSHVQTAADSWKIYGLPKGTPGVACNGHLSGRK